tara:strand:+ start:1415 stop:1639 length:225 start_codon:yes stop_codon:yes gene_type:complete
MPKACVEKMIAKGMSPEKAHKVCYPGQKPASTSQEEQDKVMWDMAKSKNVRMKKKLKKQATSGPGKNPKWGKSY